MSFVPMPPGSPAPALAPLYELDSAAPAKPARADWRNALYRSRWLSLAIVVAFVAAALAATRWIRPYYEASGTIIVAHPSLHDAEITPQEYPPPVDLDRELQTELTVLGSRSVVDPVMAKLRLETRDPEIARALAGVNRGLAKKHEHLSPAPAAQLAYGVFSQKLKLLPDKLSDTVQVVYGSHDGGLAAEVVNALTAQFLKTTLAARAAAGDETSAWMRQQMAAARQQLAADDAAVADFQRAHDYIPLAEGGAAESGLLARLSDAEHAWSAAQAARLGDEAALASYRGNVVAALPAELRNPAIDRAADNVGAAAQQLSALTATYRPDFPLVVEARAQLAGAERTLAGLEQQVRQGLAQRLAASTQQENELARSVQGLEQQAAAASGVEMEFGVLKARADAQRALLAALEPKLAEIEMEATLPPANIRVLDPAQPPLAPAYPKLGLDLALGLGLGVATALGVALGREHFSATLTGTEAVSRHLGPALAPLGMIADQAPPRPAPRALPAAGGLAPGEGYAKIAANLVARSGPPPRVLLITSPNPGEGKTTTVCRVGTALAQGGWRTLVVDCDLARPGCHEVFGLANTLGLVAAQAGRKVAPLAVAPHLDLMPCESGTGAPLQARAVAGLLEQWREHYDYILLDSPPGGLSGDAVLLSSLAEGVVLVLRWGRTRLAEAERLCEELARAHAPLLGTLLNRADPQAPAFRAYRRLERA